MVSRSRTLRLGALLAYWLALELPDDGRTRDSPETAEILDLKQSYCLVLLALGKLSLLFRSLPLHLEVLTPTVSF